MNKIIVKIFNTNLHITLGIFTLIVVTLNLLINYNSPVIDPYKLFWYCDYTAIILGIAMIKKNSMYVSFSLASAIPAQGMWVIDFIMELFGFGLGRTAQVFSETGLDALLSVLIHLIVIPISCYGVYKLGFSKKVLKITIIILLVMAFSSFYLTDVIDNKNCVFYACDAEDPMEGYMKYFYGIYIPFWIIALTSSHFSLIWAIRRFKIGKGVI